MYSENKLKIIIFCLQGFLSFFLTIFCYVFFWYDPTQHFNLSLKSSKQTSQIYYYVDCRADILITKLFFSGPNLIMILVKVL